MRTAPQLRTELVVWLDPGPRGAPPALVRALQEAVRLVVVPRTGRRRAEVAVLLAPAAEVLGRVRRVLPDAVLLAVPQAAPDRAYLDVARWEGVHVLPPGAGPEQVVQQVLALGRPGGAAPRSGGPLALPVPREADPPPGGPVGGADAVVDEVAALLGRDRQALLAELLRSDRLRALAAEHGRAVEVALRLQALERSPTT